MKKFILFSILGIGCLLAYKKYSTTIAPSVSAAKKCGQFGDCLKMALHDKKEAIWSLYYNTGISPERTIKFLNNEAKPNSVEKKAIEAYLGVKFN